MVSIEIRLIIFFAAKDGEALYSWELTVALIMNSLSARFRGKLKKVGKTTRPFRYNLHQIPYDYTVEARNRFKGLDLIECLMNYGMRLMTGDRDQDHPHGKEMQKSKMAVWGGLTNSCEKKRSEKQRRKGKI